VGWRARASDFAEIRDTDFNPFEKRLIDKMRGTGCQRLSAKQEGWNAAPTFPRAITPEARREQHARSNQGH
jgi:hypothetical protein